MDQDRLFKMPWWGWWATDALLIEKPACQEHGGEQMVPVLHFTSAKLMSKSSKVSYSLSSCVFCHHWSIYLTPFVWNLCSLHLTVLWYINSAFYFIRGDGRSGWQNMSFGNKSKKSAAAHLQLVMAWYFSEQSVKQNYGPSSVFTSPILASTNQTVAAAGMDFLYVKIDLYVNTDNG